VAFPDSSFKQLDVLFGTGNKKILCDLLSKSSAVPKKFIENRILHIDDTGFSTSTLVPIISDRHPMHVEHDFKIHSNTVASSGCIIPLCLANYLELDYEFLMNSVPDQVVIGEIVAKGRNTKDKKLTPTNAKLMELIYVTHGGVPDYKLIQLCPIVRALTDIKIDDLPADFQITDLSWNTDFRKFAGKDLNAYTPVMISFNIALKNILMMNPGDAGYVDMMRANSMSVADVTEIKNPTLRNIAATLGIKSAKYIPYVDLTRLSGVSSFEILSKAKRSKLVL
jgi:hypothetical protein